MSRLIKLKRGFDIRLSGRAEKKLTGQVTPLLYGVKPPDFPGLIPKLDVRPGDKVKAGSSLFHDKIRPEVLFTSPVSGMVTAVDRGTKRKILGVVVEKSGEEYIDFGKADPGMLTREQIKERMLASGLWPSVRQRPYNIVANPADTPKSVFISGFDTAPLAPDFYFIVENTSAADLRLGLTAIKKLTEGKINMVLDGRRNDKTILEDIPEAEITYVSGPHPAGNVGVQIHHIDPVNKGEVVWHINLQDVAAIGRLFSEGIYRPERIVAITGSEVINTGYCKMLSGGAITPLAENNVKTGNNRYISGNVLAGVKIPADGFLGYYDSQITVIPEGDHSDFFGWASPGFNKFSFFRVFASSLFPKKHYRLDTNLNGGERAFVITGQYEKVLPMDIYPMHLFKAIMAGDIDAMENLGIYEVAEEDFALCEYICPSKTEIQSVIRQGIDLMIKEMS